MKRIRLLLLCIPCVLFGQQPTSLLTPRGAGPTGPTGPPPATAAPSELTVQQSRVAPSNLPDRFEFGRQSALTEAHEYQIKELQGKVGGIESTVNWGKGVFAGVTVLVLGVLATLRAVLKAFWKPIARILFEEAVTSKAAKIEPEPPPPPLA